MGCSNQYVNMCQFFNICSSELHLLTMIALGFPITHRLILLSSPPVASILPLLGLRQRQFTADPWATNSAAERKLASFCTSSKLLYMRQIFISHNLSFTKLRGFLTTTDSTSVLTEPRHVNYCACMFARLFQIKRTNKHSF